MFKVLHEVCHLGETQMLSKTAAHTPPPACDAREHEVGMRVEVADADD
jgi:hypothetical protein